EDVIRYYKVTGVQTCALPISRRTDEAIKTAKQADLAVPFKTIQLQYDSALAHVKSFQTAYSERRYYQADDELTAARNEFALAFRSEERRVGKKCRTWLGETSW